MRLDTGLVRRPSVLQAVAIGRSRSRRRRGEGRRSQRMPGPDGGHRRPQVRRGSDGAEPRPPRAAAAADGAAGGRARCGRQLRQHHRGERVRQGHAGGDAADAPVPEAATGGDEHVLLLSDEQEARGSRQLVRDAVRSPPPHDDRARQERPHLRRPCRPARHRLDRARRSRVGCDVVRASAPT